jgi:putative effector of murein hydrolase
VGNSLVRTVGVAWVIIGLVLMIQGLLLSNTDYEDYSNPTTAERWIDAGVTMLNLGLALVVLAVIVYLIGLWLRPSMSEILRAERVVAENRRRLQEYDEELTPSKPGSHWDD